MGGGAGGADEIGSRRFRVICALLGPTVSPPLLTPSHTLPSRSLGVVTYNSATLVTLGGCAPQYRTYQYTVTQESLNTAAICSYDNTTNEVSTNFGLFIPSGACSVQAAVAAAAAGGSGSGSGRRQWQAAHGAGSHCLPVLASPCRLAPAPS